MKTLRGLFAVIALLMIAAGAEAAEISCSAPQRAADATYEYFVSLADLERHTLRVQVRYHTGKPAEFQMPLWNALYQIRDFAQYVSRVVATDGAGNALAIEHPAPSTWRVQAAEGCAIFAYSVYADTPGPFGNQINLEHTFLNWAQTLVYPAQERTAPLRLSVLDIPDEWSLADLGLFADEKKTGEAHLAHAVTFDQLADSPVEIGPGTVATFEDSGARYRIVFDAKCKCDFESMQDIVQRIVHAGVDWMQDRPYDRYTFVYHFPRNSAGGGMEHANGTAIDISADAAERSPKAIASITAHEFFHLWNVKRIRPQGLEPIDYTRQQDTRALWFSEGVTSTVGSLLLVRAGLIDEQAFLARLAGSIAEFESRPARNLQSPEQSGTDAWFEGYPYYRRPERSVSYYISGEVLGTLLDLRMRSVSGGRKSLRDLFQWMNATYAGQGRFFDDTRGVQQAVEAVTGKSFDTFFADHVRSMRPIDYDKYFDLVGLTVKPVLTEIANAGFDAAVSLGGGAKVISVQRGSAVDLAGVRAGDTVVSADGKPLTIDMDTFLAGRKPGEAVVFRFSSASGTRDVKVVLKSVVFQAWRFMDVPGVTPAQLAHRAAWIRGDNLPAGGAQ